MIVLLTTIQPSHTLNVKVLYIRMHLRPNPISPNLLMPTFSSTVLPKIIHGILDPLVTSWAFAAVRVCGMYLSVRLMPAEGRNIPLR
jgi:hypothetical protein